MAESRAGVDWSEAYMTCPICGHKQYGRRKSNWHRGERVCGGCVKEYTKTEIESMLTWLEKVSGPASREKSPVFRVEWAKRHRTAPMKEKK